MSPACVPLLTVFAMLAFASNSLLCRVALRDTAIDAASFTAIRLASGALMLLVLLRLRGVAADERRKLADGGDAVRLCRLLLLRLSRPHGGDRRAAAVRRRPAHHDGLGPVAGRARRRHAAGGPGDRGRRPGRAAAAGAGRTAAACRRADAGRGAAWGVYSLLGKGAGEPIAATGGNFLRVRALRRAADPDARSATKPSIIRACSTPCCRAP